MRPLVTLMGTAVALLGLVWMAFSNQAPFGLAFLLTGISLVMLSFNRKSRR